MFSFYTNSKSVDTVLKTVRKNNAEIISYTESGIPFTFKKLKNRPGLLVGAVLCILITLVSSVMIWEVKVTGNTYVENDDIVRLLKSVDIAEGKFINKGALDKAYNKILLQDDRIARIAVNFDGTIAIAEIDETEKIPPKLNRNRNINIVAKCDGVIKRMDVLDGTREVLDRETVNKGQLLISSFVETLNEGTVMRAARGSVWAETTHIYEIFVSGKYTNNSENVDVGKRSYLNILGIEFPIRLSFGNDNDKYKLKREIKRVNINEKVYFPATVRHDYIHSYIQKEIFLTEAEAEIIARSELEYRINCQIGGGEVLNEKMTSETIKDGYVFRYEIACIENIAEEHEFQFE